MYSMEQKKKKLDWYFLHLEGFFPVSPVPVPVGEINSPCGAMAA